MNIALTGDVMLGRLVDRILDYGPEALVECLARLDQAGIRHAGAGLNRTEAVVPALVPTDAGPLAVIAMTDNEPQWEATSDRPGVHLVAYDTQGLVEPYRSRLRHLIAAARHAAALVIISAHVGPNWGVPSAAIRTLAHEFIDLGADLYWGHSNHTLQGMELYHDKLILYATGDFIDDYAADPVERNDRSFLFIAELEGGRIRRMRLHPVVIEDCRVHQARGAEARFLVTARSALLEGTLGIPAGACAIVLFAHGSGSRRFSPRNRTVVHALRAAGLATLLIDLLTPDEEAIDLRTRRLRFDIALLAERLVGATDWLTHNPAAHHLRIGYFGASTGAAAALVAAAAAHAAVGAVVSRGGRPDLASAALPHVRAPTLLIVGANDGAAIPLNEQALAQLGRAKQHAIVPGATLLFEEPGALAEVAHLACRWFEHYLVPAGTQGSVER